MQMGCCCCRLFGGVKLDLITGKDVSITFDDIAGIDQVKQEIVELVQFLRNPKRFLDLGARSPAGVLLVGPPGTGKQFLPQRSAMSLAHNTQHHVHNDISGSRLQHTQLTALKSSCMTVLWQALCPWQCSGFWQDTYKNPFIDLAHHVAQDSAYLCQQLAPTYGNCSQGIMCAAEAAQA